MRLVRHGANDVHWNWGYVLSVPVALLLVQTHGDGDPTPARYAAMLAVVLGLPWIVPAFIVVAILSAPVYAWLHTVGPTPDVMAWLGGTVLVGAVLGCHVNAALLATRLRRPPMRRNDGLGDFLRRPRNGAAH